MNLFTEIVVKPLSQKKWWLVEVITALIVMALAQAGIVILVGPFFKVMFQSSDGVGDLLLADLLPGGVVRMLPALGQYTIPGQSLVFWVPALILVVGVMRSLARYLYQTRQAAIGLHVATVYRSLLFERILSQTFAAATKKTAAAWMSNIMNDVLFLQQRFSEIVASLLRDTVLVLACFAALVAVHWQAALLLVAAVPFIALGLGAIGKRIARYADQWQRDLAHLAGRVLDLRERFDFIRAESGEDYEQRRFDRLNHDYYRAVRQSIFIRSTFAPGLEFMGFLVFAGFVAMMTTGRFGAAFSGDKLLQFFAALGLLLRPLRNLGEQLSRYNETMGSLRESIKIMNTSARSDSQSETSQGMSETSVRVSMQASHPGAQHAVDVQDLLLEPSKSLAIIGPSGAGKSTLIRTLTGLIEPSRWESSCSWSALAANVSLVSQAPFLFDDTIRANLSYGLATSPASSELESALRAVNCYDDVSRMPAGLDTKFNLLTTNFSGGQIQRLVVARALLRNKRILIFDEATSAVDPTSEEDITKRMIAHCQAHGRMFISVTHRLQWLASFDRVCFMEAGKVLHVGSHDDLLHHQRYREFCQA